MITNFIDEKLKKEMITVFDWYIDYSSTKFGIIEEEKIIL